MTDFPEKIWIGSDDKTGSIYLEGDESSLVHHDDAREYIRSGLVPQWQPIETAPESTNIFAVMKDGKVRCIELINSSYPRIECKMTGYWYPIEQFTRWMHIPKVPEWIKNEKR